jgi:hypothetical protein
MRVPEKTEGRTATQALWADRTGSAGLPYFTGLFSLVFRVPHYFLIAGPCGKVSLVKIHEKL